LGGGPTLSKKGNEGEGFYECINSGGPLLSLKGGLSCRQRGRKEGEETRSPQEKASRFLTKKNHLTKKGVPNRKGGGLFQPPQRKSTPKGRPCRIALRTGRAKCIQRGHKNVKEKKSVYFTKKKKTFLSRTGKRKGGKKELIERGEKGGEKARLRNREGRDQLCLLKKTPCLGGASWRRMGTRGGEHLSV